MGLRDWYRNRRFVRAYMTLRHVADRHVAQGHDVDFTAVNEGLISLRCHTCNPGARARVYGARP